MATIRKEWRERKKKYVWGFDAWIKSSSGKRKRVRDFEFDSKDEATEALAFLLGRVKSVRYGPAVPPYQPLLSELIKKRLATLKPGSELTRETRVLVEWLALLDPSVDATQRTVTNLFSKVTVTSIGTPQIRLYADKRAADGQSPASIKREMVIIAAMIHQATEFFQELSQWVPPKMPYPKMSKSRRERVITDAEFAAIMGYLMRETEPGEKPGDYRERILAGQMLEFAMTTACRHSEIMRLKWSNVDWDRKRLIVYQTKTDSHKQIPFTASIERILAARQEKREGSEFVFGKGQNTNTRLYRELREACEACCIPYGKNDPDGIVLHTARHTVTTRLVGAGLDLDTVGQITGHRAKALIAHYTHHTPASMARAGAALEKIGQKLSGIDGAADEIIHVLSAVTVQDGETSILSVTAADGRVIQLRFENGVSVQSADTPLPCAIDPFDQSPLATELPQ